MRQLFRLLLVQVLVLLFTLSSSIGQQLLDSQLEDIRNQFEGVGLAVVVVKKGKPIYSGAFGYKDLEKQEKLDLNNLFRIASISKSFSATAVMQLVEKGKLTLDDKVSDLIGFKVEHPKYPDTPITLRMLLSHTSSLNDSEGYFTLDVIDPATNANAVKCYNDYRPGTDYQYCNLNFNIVGTIIEKVSGERFDQYIRKNILDPLGLEAGYDLDSLDRSRFATLYEYNKDTKSLTPSPAAYTKTSPAWKNYRMGRSTPLFSPTGGMKISPVDLATYMTMHMYLGKHKGKRIISKKSAELMQKPVPNAKEYGLALWTSDRVIPGVTVKGHTGSAYGLFSMMIFNPEKKWGIVLITNGCNPVYKDGYVELLSSSANLLYKELL